MIRLIIGATILTGCVWFTFTVKLGRKTFAEHIEAINKTSEARDLVNGVRSIVRPALNEAKERVLGEYVEAPTSVHRIRPNSSSSTATASTAGPGKQTIRGKAGHNQNRRPTSASSCSSSSSSSEGGQSVKNKKPDSNRTESPSRKTPLENPDSKIEGSKSRREVSESSRNRASNVNPSTRSSNPPKNGESRGPKTRKTEAG